MYRFSAESEYRSMANTCCELVWISALLKDFGIPVSMPIPLYCDNKAALHIASNLVFHERTKHIEKDCHLVWDKLMQGFISTHHVSTLEQPTDLLTKSLASQHLKQLFTKLSICNLFNNANLRGML